MVFAVPGYGVSVAGGSHDGAAPAIPRSRSAAPVGWAIAPATRFMKVRVVAVATRRKIARSRPAPTAPSGGRYAPASVSDGDLLPGRGQRDVGVQGGEQPAAGPGGFPPQRQHGGGLAGHQVPEVNLDQPGYTRGGTQRADPGQAGDPLVVGRLRSAQQRAAASQVRQPGLSRGEADISSTSSLMNTPGIKPGHRSPGGWGLGPHRGAGGPRVTSPKGTTPRQ